MDMNLRAFATFALLLFFIRSAHAQTWADSLTKSDRFWSRSGGYARELALGGGGFGMLADSGFATLAVNPYSVDPLFMLQNPAYASHYPSYLWFDAGVLNPANQTGPPVGIGFGTTFSISENFVGGVTLARNDAAGFSLLNPNIFASLTTLSSNFSYVPPGNTWELFSSIKTGIVNIGLGLSYATSSASTTDTSNLATSRFANFHQIGISAGAIINFDDDGLFDIDANALFPSLSSGTNTSGDIKMTVLGLNTRALLPIRSEFYLVPIANFYYSKGTSTFIASPMDLSTSSNIDLGIGVNFWQGGLHFMGGVSGGYYRNSTPSIAGITPQLSKSQTIIPRWNFGAEWPILHWLDIRLGYIASSGSQTIESQLSATTTASTTRGVSNLYSPFYSFPFGDNQSSGVTVGAAAHVGRFAADVTMLPTALRALILNVAADQMFGDVTLSYRFD